jgi:hypothetical protein
MAVGGLYAAFLTALALLRLKRTRASMEYLKVVKDKR